MRKVLVIASLGLLLLSPASAQVQPVRLPPPGAPAQQPPAVTRELPPDVINLEVGADKLREIIARLQRQQQDLLERMGDLANDRNKVATELFEMKRAGGSLVHAQCVSATLSRRTDGGGEENCEAGGYKCSPVEGTCYRQCSTSLHCAGETSICDTTVGRCIPPPRGLDD